LNSRRVVFIAYKDQPNLGVGYLSAVLFSKGFEAETVDFRLEPEETCRLVKGASPMLVGFSLIFQFYLPRMGELAKYLRDRGVRCHFVVGGHYPSLRPDDVLARVPELDSVVLFEGESTICELADRLSSGADWRDIAGLAYRKEGKPFSNALRPLVKDLDSLPFPVRDADCEFHVLDKKYTSIIASRGCVWNCAFCSIREFYGRPPGGLRRSRSPANVVAEIKQLFEADKAQVFLFQDDDFLAPGRLREPWLKGFVDALDRAGLSDEILWKINCRCDEVDLDTFRELGRVGLRSVYLGIESGNQTSLQYMDKHLKAEDSLRAVRVLEKLNISYEYGFMLFDPSSTFESVKTNIAFLRQLCGNGSSPVTACKMAPYAETEVERRLIAQGRLKGSVAAPDYNFQDHRLDWYCMFLLSAFYDWIYAPTGLLAKFRWRKFEVAVEERFHPSRQVRQYDKSLRRLISASNAVFLRFADETASAFEDEFTPWGEKLEELLEWRSSEEKRIDSELHQLTLRFNRLWERGSSVGRPMPR